MALLHVRDGGSSSLGLGWILLIALGGGILFFMAVGLLLAWHLQSKNKIKTARVYSYTVGPLSRGHSTMKLSKRRLLATDYSTSRLSSRLSMSLPRLSLLPPLPSYQSFFRGKSDAAMDGLERSESIMMARWTAPEERGRKRDSWIGSLRDSWLGRAPTLPTVDAESKMATEQQQFGHPYMQDWEMGQQLPQGDEVELQGSRTEPALAWDRQGWPRDDVEEYRGRQRAKTSEKPMTRPFVGDQDLRTILQSTEQRLRSGSSQSPVKTPRSSPHKSSSPRKTPRSHMTTSSGGSTRAHRGTPSPSKRTPGRETPGGMSQHGSTTSIGSAANSLIAEAIEQLELPGGSCSPSKSLQVQEWQPQPQPQPQHYQEEEEQQPHQQELEMANLQSQNQPAQRSLSPQKHGQQNPRHYRRKSDDSDVSSSLSTVYSANEPEEIQPKVDENDPFVEAGGVRRSLTARSAHRFNGPRPLRRRSQTVADATRPMQQREQSTTIQHSRRVSKDWSRSVPTKQDGIVPPVSLDPPVTSDEKRQGLTAASSESSMVTISVHTTDDEEGEGDLPTPKASQNAEFSPRMNRELESTPTKVKMSLDISSSPLNEQDILRLLLASSNRRALPHPPEGTRDDSTVPTPLNPRPKSHHGSPLAKTSTSPRSSSSSDYDQESVADTLVDEHLPPSPSRASSVVSRQSTVRSTKDMPGVTSTVAELRRMNSLISSYSCASVASTAVGESDTVSNLANQPPTAKSGSMGMIVPRSKPGSIGSKHYLSLGKSSPPKRSGSRKKGQSVASPRPQSRAGHRRTQSIDEGKENQHGLGLKMPRIEISSPASSTHSSPTRNNGNGLREDRKGGNLGRDSSFSSMTSLRGRSKLHPVQEGTEESRIGLAGDNNTAGQDARPESLGLYDSDGFLIGSPDREKRLSRSLR